MLRELFKTQIIITEVTQEKIEFVTRLALYKSELKDDAMDEVLIDTKGYQFSASDKLFFMPGCTVPRFKVKQLCEATGMSVVKTPDRATVIIKGDDTSKEVTSLSYDYHTVTVDQLRDWINDNYSVGNIGTLKLKQELDKEDIFDMVVLSDYNVRGPLISGPSNASSKWVKKTIKDTQTTEVWASEDKRIRDFDKILDLNLPIVYQNDLLAIINTNNVMDKHMYEEAVKMFDSEDTNNHVLAMELMANCDYQKSAIYLLSLLKKFHSKISYRKEKDHVNFSALCTFFDVQAGCYYTLDGIIEILTKRNLISSSELPILMEIAREDLEDDISSNYFKISGIEPNDELAEAIQRADQILVSKQASQSAAPVTENTESND